MSQEEQAIVKELGKSGALVLKLMSELYGKGHHLHLDNRYTSERIFAYLEQNGTVASGTAMGNRLKVPNLLKTKPLEKVRYSFRRNQNMLMVRYKDKEIYFLFTIHKANTVRVAKRRRNGISASKLTLVNGYNKNMGSVDRNDALNGNYSSVRKTQIWTVEVVMHFIEETVLNSFIFYNKVNPLTTNVPII